MIGDLESLIGGDGEVLFQSESEHDSPTKEIVIMTQFHHGLSDNSSDDDAALFHDDIASEVP